MLVMDSTGRQAQIEVYGKHDDDIQIVEAYYLDTGEDLHDEEVDYIMRTYDSEIYQEWYENQIAAAEAYHDRDR